MIDGLAVGGSEAERVLGSRGPVTLEGDTIDRTEGSRVDLMLQQVDQADTTEQLDHLASVAAAELPPSDERTVRDAIAVRGKALVR